MAKKNPAAVALGRKGGKNRAKAMTAEERATQAKKAAEARWADHTKLEQKPKPAGG